MMEREYMLMDDAQAKYEVDMSIFYDSLENVYQQNPGIDDTRIWTIHEAEDGQYWSSGLTGFVNRMGYYVAAKPTVTGIRIDTSCQCVYCDMDECVCQFCNECQKRECHCDCESGFNSGIQFSPNELLAILLSLAKTIENSALLSASEVQKLGQIRDIHGKLSSHCGKFANDGKEESKYADIFGR